MAMNSRKDQQPANFPQGKATPNPDMQPEDAGTAASGNEEQPANRGTPATRVMKQEHKTPQERGR